jgi:hypothetical protein
MVDEEYKKITDTHQVTRPVTSSIHENLTDAWRINKHLSMWLIFDMVTPVRRFKRGMLFNDSPDIEFPSYGPPPWDNLTETDSLDSPGLMQYAPITHRYAPFTGYRRKRF